MDLYLSSTKHLINAAEIFARKWGGGGVGGGYLTKAGS